MSKFKANLSGLCGIMAMFFLTFLVCGCISFSKPEKTIVLNMVAQSSGVMLAQGVPKVAGEVLKYSEKALEVGEVKFTEATFHEWSREMIKRLDVHPLLKVNFNELIKLVKIEVTLAGDPGETVRLYREVIENFVVGIKVGSK